MTTKDADSRAAEADGVAPTSTAPANRTVVAGKAATSSTGSGKKPKATAKGKKSPGLKLPKPHPSSVGRPKYLEFHPDILMGGAGPLRVDRSTAFDPARRASGEVVLGEDGVRRRG